MKYRTVLSATVLATVTSLIAVESSVAWPQLPDMGAGDHGSIVLAQMGGMGGMGGGMGGGGMGGMGGGGMGGGGMGGGGMGGGGMGGGGMGGGGMGAGGMGAGGMGGMGAGGKGGGGMGAGGMGGMGAGGMGAGGMGGGGMGGAAGGMGGMGGSVVNVHGTTVRSWSSRPYFGTVVGGVALGSLIAATAVPVAPAPNLCWIWTSPAHTQGFWDYCTPPQ